MTTEAGSADAEQSESYYRDLLAEQVGGRTEVHLPFGRADVLTDTHIYEVEPVTTWRHGAAQALQYGSQVAQKAALALYGDDGQLPRIRRRLELLPEPGLELWWFAEGKFAVLATATPALPDIVLGPGVTPELVRRLDLIDVTVDPGWSLGQRVDAWLELRGHGVAPL